MTGITNADISNAITNVESGYNPQIFCPVAIDKDILDIISKSSPLAFGEIKRISTYDKIFKHIQLPNKFTLAGLLRNLADKIDGGWDYDD